MEMKKQSLLIKKEEDDDDKLQHYKLPIMQVHEVIAIFDFQGCGKTILGEVRPVFHANYPLKVKEKHLYFGLENLLQKN